MAPYSSRTRLGAPQRSTDSPPSQEKPCRPGSLTHERRSGAGSPSPPHRGPAGQQPPPAEGTGPAAAASPPRWAPSSHHSRPPATCAPPRRRRRPGDRGAGGSVPVGETGSGRRRSRRWRRIIPGRDGHLLLLRHDQRRKREGGRMRGTDLTLLPAQAGP